MTSRSPRLLGRAVAIALPPLLFILLGLLGLEAWLRWERFGVPALIQPHLYMAPGWTNTECFKPGPQQELMTPGCVVRYKGVWVDLNDEGLHDRAVDETKPHFRMLALGDSTSMAAGVENEEIYHSILEDRLNEELGTPGFVEIYNYGRGGRSPAEQIGDIEKTVRKRPIDAALVTFTPGSLWGVLAKEPLCLEVGESLSVTPADLEFHRVHGRGISTLSSALGKFEEWTGLWIFQWPKDAVRRAALSWRYDDQNRERLEALRLKAVDLFRRCALKLRKTADRTGIELAWILLWYQPSQDGELLVETLRELGEPVLPTPILIDDEIRRADLVIYPGEVHPNAHAHRLFSEKIYDGIADLGWQDRIREAHARRTEGTSEP